MDNKLTKKRLSNYLAYEWILIIIVLVLVIFAWELIYSVTAVRLSVGRQFKLYYDENIYSSNAIFELIKKDTFSYDIIYSQESLNSDYNVLYARLSIQEGDVIITDSMEKDNKAVRAKTIIDDYKMYTLDALLSDAENYLKKLDTDEKIKANFLSRMDGDNRFRTDEEKANGIKQEIERIEKLRVDVEYFKTFLETATEDCFYRYTRFSQSKEKASDRDKSDYERYVQNEINNGRENAIYGINVGALTGGEHNPSEYCKVIGTDEATNVTVLVFNFLSYQPDLQFETISFLNTLLKACGYPTKSV